MRIGVWDLETTGFNANFGHLLAGSVMPLWGKKKDIVTFRIDQFPGYRKAMWDDTRIVTEMVKALNEYDVLVGHNSVDFDTKFINTRALDNRTPWVKPDMKHVDSKRACKKFLRFGYRSLDNLSILLETKDKKTPLIAKQWRKAIGGDTASLDMIVKHNVQDVLTLAEIVRTILQETKMPYEYVR